MGSSDILKYLKKCNEPQTRKQIADAIGFSPERTSKLIKKLIKYHDILFIEHSSEEASKIVTYKLVRRTRFYFIG